MTIKLPIGFRPAQKNDALQLAQLINTAGEGIPFWLWQQAAEANQDPWKVGAARAARTGENFCFENAIVATKDEEITGMLLAYPLPNNEPMSEADMQSVPEFLRALIQLEECAPGSFYINAIATYPKHQSHGIGAQLMEIANQLANEAGCTELSLIVFDENISAVKFYERLRYETTDTRPVVPHISHPHKGKALLMRKPAA